MSQRYTLAQLRGAFAAGAARGKPEPPPPDDSRIGRAIEAVVIELWQLAEERGLAPAFGNGGSAREDAVACLARLSSRCPTLAEYEAAAMTVSDQFEAIIEGMPGGELAELCAVGCIEAIIEEVLTLRLEGARR